jgi:ribonucleoside-triphosphate reductase
VVTINLPRLGLTSAGKREFLARLKELMSIAKESLEIKRKVLERFTESGLYPYTKFYLRNVKSRYGRYWKNHFSTIGVVGMNEALQNLTGQSLALPEGRQLAEEVLTYMRDMLLCFQEETGNNYNLEATPAEGSSFRLALLDQEHHEGAVFANGRGKAVRTPFYTNSTQLPVDFSDDVFEVLELQDDLQTKYTGGTVLHFFLGERVEDTATVKNLVRRICEDYHLPYFTLSPTFSICPNHGYIPAEATHCPRCKARCEVYSRVVGYLRPTDQWNDGKKAEFDMRKTFNIRS